MRSDFLHYRTKREAQDLNGQVVTITSPDIHYLERLSSSVGERIPICQFCCRRMTKFVLSECQRSVDFLFVHGLLLRYFLRQIV